MHLSAAVFGFCLACLLSLALTPLVRRLARKRNLEDLPDERKLHRRPRPHIGGLAIFVALIAALVGTSLFFPELDGTFLGLVRGLIPAAALVVVAGLIDDLRGSRPWKKLAAQFVAIGLLAAQVDVLGLEHAVAGGLWGWLLSFGLMLPWFLGLTNGMNLIDGLDGLAAGVASIQGLGFVLLGFALGQPGPAIVAAILVGATLGFLRSNAHPATIFMGDTGSMFLGFALAGVGACLFWSRPEPLTVLSILLLSWVPALDAGFTVLRRSSQRRSLFQPDLGHIHHRLLGAGFSHRNAGLALCGLSALSAVAGVQVGLQTHPWAWAGAVLLATLPLIWILRTRPARREIPTGATEVAQEPRPSRRMVSQDRAA